MSKKQIGLSINLISNEKSLNIVNMGFSFKRYDVGISKNYSGIGN